MKNDAAYQKQSSHAAMKQTKYNDEKLTKRERIKNIQQELRRQGYDPGPADGVMGARTAAALKKYQRDNDLRQTGRIDEDTCESLQEGSEK